MPRESRQHVPLRRLDPKVISGVVFGVLFTLPALAEGAVPVGGVFGNKEGCRAYQTGQPIADYMMLTEDTFSSRRIGCAFQSVISIEKGVFTVEAICSPGGKQTVRVVDHGSAGYGFLAGSESELGPMFPCSPAKITGSLVRVQI